MTTKSTLLSSRSPSWDVQYEDHGFTLKDVTRRLQVRVETPLPLDSAFENRPVEIHSMALRGLAENSIFEVHMAGSRIGLIVPANAVGSIDHDYASKKFFHQCAYLIMKTVLRDISRGNPLLIQAIEAQVPLHFPDLFHDNICFLIADVGDSDDARFSFDQILPSLVAYGYVPAGTGDTADLAWRSALPPQKKLHVSPMSSDVINHDIVARLSVSAAISAPSGLLQFFYLYQILEHLLEGVLRHRLPSFAKSMITNLELGDGDLHDEFLVMNEQMREKVRLSLLVSQYANCAESLEELGSACTAFLRSLGLKERFGIEAVYAVRNFLFHQARKLPVEGDDLLDDIIEAFVLFIPALLNTYKIPPID